MRLWAFLPQHDLTIQILSVLACLQVNLAQQ